MIHVINCDLLSIEKGVIIHGCNARGVMGSGVAKQIRDKYPEAYRAYKEWESDFGLTLGDVIPYQVTEDLLILNAITQENYGRDPNVRYVNYGAVAECFQEVNECEFVREGGSLFFPRIGAGLANGDWEVISEIIDFVYQGDKFLCIHEGDKNGL